MNVLKPGRFDRWMLLVLAGLALGLGGLALVSSLVGLRQPEPGAALVGVWGPVGLTFGQKMQAAGVESRWHSQPPLAGRFAWDGLTLWFWPAFVGAWMVRWLVRGYYAAGPSLARFVERRPRVRALTRAVLTRIHRMLSRTQRP